MPWAWPCRGWQLLPLVFGFLAGLLTGAATAAEPPAAGSLQVTPAELRLPRQLDRAQLLVTAAAAADPARHPDLTTAAIYRSEEPRVATVDTRGLVTAVATGTTAVVVEAGGRSFRVPVAVAADLESVDFHRDVRPILAKAGCASGPCHAAQHGKGGFRLSVFGFDPESDHREIAFASRGRRVNPASPRTSLLLRKPTMAVAHGGGPRLAEDSVEYDVLRRWIAAGAAASPKDVPTVRSLRVTPDRRVGDVGFTQQLRAVATSTDGTERDVTPLAAFDSGDPSIATVDARGLVTAVGHGQTVVMARYDGQAVVTTILVPFRERVELAGWQPVNFVDEHAARKFRDLGLEPAPLCDDATFVRRAYLDAIGGLPDPATVTAFSADPAADKRIALVDALLGLSGDPARDIHGDRYAAWWTLKWSDLIRNNSTALGEQGMWALHNWIRDAFRENRPFDRFVRELITAQGSIYSSGPANYYRINASSSDLAEATAQLFLGVRLECAKCHQHPFEKYSQADYYGMAAFFARVGFKNSEDFGLFGRESVVMVKDSGDVSHPRTGKRLDPAALDGPPLDHPLDRRIALAEWLTGPDNPFFARSVVNRYVRSLLGAGLVEPVDDMRSTNPASNAPLLDALAADFAGHGFDVRRLMRTIMTSRLYGLSSRPTPETLADTRFYSHFAVKRLAAEPLLDAIDQATGTRTKFPNLPLGTRAIDLADAEYADFFLNTFAKPRRASVCECERSPDANLAQVLHTFNGELLARKIADKDGHVARLVAEKVEPDEAIRRLYLQSLCRPPDADELEHGRQLVKESATPQQAYEDLLWALINSKQFLFVH
jgi:hypothetical protein